MEERRSEVRATERVEMTDAARSQSRAVRCGGLARRDTWFRGTGTSGGVSVVSDRTWMELSPGVHNVRWVKARSVRGFGEQLRAGTVEVAQG